VTGISATVRLHTDAQRAAALITTDTAALLGDEVGIDIRRGPVIRQRVTFELGAPETDGLSTRWSLAWQPVGPTTALPAFSGALAVRGMTDGTSALCATGAYLPPLGVVGVIVDRVIGHRVAEASVEQFLAGVARRLERAAVQASGRDWRGPERAPDLRPA
jgi:hypothetical protein